MRHLDVFGIGLAIGALFTAGPYVSDPNVSEGVYAVAIVLCGIFSALVGDKWREQ